VIHALHALHRALEGNVIAQIACHTLDRQIFQYREIARGANQHAHGIAGSDKLPRDVASHETRGARYQRNHKEWRTRSSRAAVSRQILQVRLRATNMAALAKALEILALRKPQRRFTTSEALIG
jgi:hypothetical protein